MTEIHVFLAQLWFGLLVLMLIFYVLADGSRIGLGILMLFVRDRQYLQLIMGKINSITNNGAIWLLLFWACLFAVFPSLYTQLLHGFIVPIILILLALISRGLVVGLQKYISNDRLIIWIFALSSLAVTLGQGYIFGILLAKAPAIASLAYFNTDILLLSFSILVAIGVAAGYAVFGATLLLVLDNRKLWNKASYWSKLAAWTMLVSTLLISLALPRFHVDIIHYWGSWPQMLYLLPWPIGFIYAFVRMLNSIEYKIAKRAHKWAALAFISALIGIVVMLYPYLIPSEIKLTEAAASNAALISMLVGVGVLMPIIFMYNGYQYLLLKSHRKEFSNAEKLNSRD